MNDVMPMLELVCSLFLKVAAGISLLCFSKACLAFTKTEKPKSAPVHRLVAKVEMPEKPVEPEPEPVAAIECGSCGKDINSAPIKQIADPENPRELYECEHCGAQVAVSLV